MKKILKILFAPQYLLLWALLAMTGFFSVLSPSFRLFDNLLEIIRSSAINAFLVVGLTWIVAADRMDVTFPDIAALSSMVVAYGVMHGLSWGLAILIALAVCCLFGLLSGVLVNFFNVHALIATIGVTTIAKATAYIIGGGSAIYYTRIDPTINLLVYGKLYGIPFLVIIILIIYLAAAFLQNQTRVGQYLYAVGENRQAAHEAGIPEKTILYVFYILSTFMAAFGGVILSASFQAGQPNFQGSFFVDGLTAVFLGALVFKAGRPNVMGTLVGAIFIMVLGNGLTMLNVPFFYGVIIKGILMVVGVIIITRSNAVSLKYGNLKRLAQKAAAK